MLTNDYDGYPAEIDYTFQYFGFLSPEYLRFSCVMAGVSFPTHRRLRYLELGCGNGVSLNIHAASCPGDYWGVDINPSHVDFARNLTKFAGTDVRLVNSSFSDLLDLPDLPDFDVIVLHGVWSWISDANRHCIIELLRRKLVDGGLFFLSYNATPGSSGLVPLQRLLRLHAQREGRGRPILKRVEAAIEFANELRDADSRFLASAPKAIERLADMRSKNPVYLAHEYFGEHWYAPSFAETAHALAPLGLHFLSSAMQLDKFEDLSVNQAGRALLNSLEDPWMRETARDYLCDQGFRRDIFIKSPLPPLASRSGHHCDLGQLSFVLVTPNGETPKRINIGVGSVNLSEPPFAGILAVLAADRYRIKSFSEIAGWRRSQEEVDVTEATRALTILIEARRVYPVQSAATTIVACRNLNEEILARARIGKPLRALASPVTGRGVFMSHVQQLCLIAYQSGMTSPTDWVAFASDILAHEDSKPISSSAGERAAKVIREAMLFQQALPIYAVLGLFVRATLCCEGESRTRGLPCRVVKIVI